MDEIQSQSPFPVTQTINLDDALARAQAEFEPIKKTRTAIVETKSGTKYKFKYADLSDVIAATTPALSKYGLSTKNLLEEDEKGMKIVVYLTHAPSSEKISSFLPIKVSDRPQELGSILSFYRRYILSALLGVASEEDDDANLAEGNSATITDKAGNKVVESVRPKAPPPSKPSQPTAQQLVDRAADPQKALRQDQARAIDRINDLDRALNDPMPNHEDESQVRPPDEEPITLLDQLVMLAENKRVPNEKMKEIIKLSTGRAVRAKELTSDELAKVIDYVAKFI